MKKLGKQPKPKQTTVVLQQPSRVIPVKPKPSTKTPSPKKQKPESKHTQTETIQLLKVREGFQFHVCHLKPNVPFESITGITVGYQIIAESFLKTQEVAGSVALSISASPDEKLRIDMQRNPSVKNHGINENVPNTVMKNLPSRDKFSYDERDLYFTLRSDFKTENIKDGELLATVLIEIRFKIIGKQEDDDPWM